MSYTPRFILKTCLFVMVASFVTGYTLFQAENLWLGPVIDLNVPSHTDSEVAEIKGTAKNIAFISFDGKQIYTDKDGNFSEKVLLAQGYNVVKVTGQDRFGRTVNKTLELMLKESENGYALTISNQYAKAN